MTGAIFVQRTLLLNPEGSEKVWLWHVGSSRYWPAVRLENWDTSPTQWTRSSTT